MPAILARLVPALIVAGLLALAYFGSARARKLASGLGEADRTTVIFLAIVTFAIVVVIVAAALSTK